jgi:DNA end-binding protein Ku
MRPIWSGSISFGIVNIPVKMYPAVRDRSIHFHQISEKDRKRIRYKKVAEGSDKELSQDQIVKGYELDSGRYVLLEDKELQQLAARKSRSIDIVDFVGLDEIDPLYFDQPYYLAPDEKAGRSYWLLLDAMEETNKVAIAQFVMRSKEYLGALRPVNGMLCLETMRYEEEIVKPSDVIDDLGKPEKVQEREIKIARQLIDTMSDEFDPSRYKNEYKARVLDYIEKKAKAKGEVPIEEEEEEGQPRSGKVLDLMAALEESLKHSKHKPGRSHAGPGHGRAGSHSSRTAGSGRGHGKKRAS